MHSLLYLFHTLGVTTLQKTFHPYAIFDHKRQAVGRILGVMSFVLGPVISSLILGLQPITGFKFLASFVISSSVVYGTLHWIFDNFLWRYSLIGKTLSIPNYSGEWNVVGETIGEEGEVKFNWEAMISINQKWDAISIQLKTAQSESYSYTANTLKLPDGRWQVSYSYSNKPNLNQIHELNAHNGFCELVFDLRNGTATGTYFNSHGRRTSGNMTLQRKRN